MAMNKVNSLHSPLLIIALTLLGYGCRALLNMVLARTMVPVLYGDLKVALNVLYILSSLLLFGSIPVAVKFLGRYLSDGSDKIARSFIRWNFQFVMKPIVWLLICCGVLIAIVLTLCYVEIHRFDHYHLAVYFALLSPLVALSYLLCAYLLALQKVWQAVALRRILPNSLILVLLVGFGLLFDHKTNGYELFLFYLIAYVLLLIVAIYMYNRRSKVPIEWGLFQQKWKNFLDWKTISVQMAVIEVLYVAIGYGDLIILKGVSAFYPKSVSGPQVGLYAATLIFSGFLFLIRSSTYKSIQPKIALMLDQPVKRDRLTGMIRRSNRIGLLILGITMLVFAFYGREILSWFGPFYQSGYPILMLLSGSVLLSALGGCGLELLLYGGGEKIYRILMTITLVIMVVFGVWLTRYFGLKGMAMTNLIARGFLSLTSYFYARKITKIPPLGYI